MRRISLVPSHTSDRLDRLVAPQSGFPVGPARAAQYAVRDALQQLEQSAYKIAEAMYATGDENPRATVNVNRDEDVGFKNDEFDRLTSPENVTRLGSPPGEHRGRKE